MSIRLGEYLDRVRAEAPLIHNITNYVTVNDCANILLACGASPIMADDPAEAEDITALCGGLHLNIGTLNQSTIPAMLLAGRRSNALGHPVLLDPVGAGASRLRTETAARLLAEVRFTAVRGNVSEIKALSSGSGSAKGVDADLADAVTDDSLESAVRLAQVFATRTGAVVAVTGAIDIVADPTRACVIRNGHPIMARITGSGCMLSAMLAAYLTACPGAAFEAAVACVCAMGVCGEQAFDLVRRAGGGSGSFRAALLDAVYGLTAEQLEQEARYAVQ